MDAISFNRETEILPDALQTGEVESVQNLAQRSDLTLLPTKKVPDDNDQRGG